MKTTLVVLCLLGVFFESEGRSYYIRPRCHFVCERPNHCKQVCPPEISKRSISKRSVRDRFGDDFPMEDVTVRNIPPASAFGSLVPVDDDGDREIRFYYDGKK